MKVRIEVAPAAHAAETPVVVASTPQPTADARRRCAEPATDRDARRRALDPATDRTPSSRRRPPSPRPPRSSQRRSLRRRPPLRRRPARARSSRRSRRRRRPPRPPPSCATIPPRRVSPRVCGTTIPPDARSQPSAPTPPISNASAPRSSRRSGRSRTCAAMSSSRTSVRPSISWRPRPHRPRACRASCWTARSSGPTVRFRERSWDSPAGRLLLLVIDDDGNAFRLRPHRLDRRRFRDLLGELHRRSILDRQAAASDRRGVGPAGRRVREDRRRAVGLADAQARRAGQRDKAGAAFALFKFVQ